MNKLCKGLVECWHPPCWNGVWTERFLGRSFRGGWSIRSASSCNRKNISLSVLIYLDCREGERGHSCKTDFPYQCKSCIHYSGLLERSERQWREDGERSVVKALQPASQGQLEDHSPEMSWNKATRGCSYCCNKHLLLWHHPFTSLNILADLIVLVRKPLQPFESAFHVGLCWAVTL